MATNFYCVIEQGKPTMSDIIKSKEMVVFIG